MKEQFKVPVLAASSAKVIITKKIADTHILMYMYTTV